MSEETSRQVEEPKKNEQKNQHKYDLNRNELTDIENKRLVYLLSPDASPKDSFEEKLLLYLKYGVGAPTTNFGKACVEYVEEYKKQCRQRKYGLKGDEFTKRDESCSVPDAVRNAGLYNTNAWASSRMRK